MRILVVEDDALIREFVVEALRDEGFDVIHASTGEEALALCGRSAANVLITDVQLPGSIDGWQIAGRCRSQDPELPVTPPAFRRSRLVRWRVAYSYGSPSRRRISSGPSGTWARRGRPEVG